MPQERLLFYRKPREKQDKTTSSCFNSEYWYLKSPLFHVVYMIIAFDPRQAEQTQLLAWHVYKNTKKP